MSRDIQSQNFKNYLILEKLLPLLKVYSIQPGQGSHIHTQEIFKNLKMYSKFKIKTKELPERGYHHNLQ
jgi:hypothetical protein